MSSLPPTFADVFWGTNDNGLEFIRKWLKTVKQSNHEFVTMIQGRIQLEEEYGKKLSKLSKFNLAKMETGTTRNALDAFNLELERSASNHLKLASDIKDQIEGPLVQMSQSHAQQRKKYKQAMKKSLKARTQAHVYSVKMHEKYEAKCRELDQLNSQRLGLMGKDYEKNEAKRKKAEHAVEEADKEYKLSIEKASEAYEIWHKESKESLKGLQDLEELRLNSIKVNLMVMSNLLTAVYGSNTESFDNVRTGLQQCSISKDLDLFIETHATGSALPPRPQYKSHYNAGGVVDKKVALNEADGTEKGSTSPSVETPVKGKGGIYDAVASQSPTSAGTEVNPAKERGFNDFFRSKASNVPKAEELWVSPNSFTPATLVPASSASPMPHNNNNNNNNNSLNNDDEFSDFTSATTFTNNNKGMMIHDTSSKQQLDDLLFENMTFK